jgi:histidinol dehydrogenase
MIRPLKRVGVYIPGGRASYPSTALMTIIPAKVAGVHEIAVCVPPARDGDVNPYTLFTLDHLGVREVYRVGGAQAIAALALGTETIAPVEKVVGPGNIYVTLAKKEVFGRVGIDMLAGPSELVVLADGKAEADLLAWEMAAQLEHGGGARACLITDSDGLVTRVRKALASRVDAGTGEPAEVTAVMVGDMAEGARLVDVLAPEHLVIDTEDMTGTLSAIHNAGAVKIEAGWPVMLERVKGRTPPHHRKRLVVRMATDRLEERMARRDPLQVVNLCRLPVCRAARVLIRQSRQLPVRIALVTAQRRRDSSRLEGMRKVREGF